MSVPTIRVLLADDHAVVRAGLRAVLMGASEVEIVGEAVNGLEVVALAERLVPDVIVMDVAMDRMDGIEATYVIVHEKQLPSKVLVLSMHEEEEVLVRMVHAGAKGYLVKRQAPAELIDAVRAVAAGKYSMRTDLEPSSGTAYSEIEAAAEERRGYASLSDRERSVLRLFAAGYSAPEIGKELAISPKTVDTYKQRINEKLRINHRTEYIRLALRLGLLH